MIKRLFISLAYSLSLLGLFQNCSINKQFEEVQSVSATSENEIQAAQKDCRFIGGPAVSSLLVNILGLPSGDVSMVNKSGEPLKSNNCKSFNHQTDGKECLYLTEYSRELNTQLCNASTFRLISQIYINACSESLAVDENVTRLFPKGSQDVSEIHLAFIGRAPRNDEVKILKELSGNFDSEQEKMTAVCAAIASSLASINSF